MTRDATTSSEATSADTKSAEATSAGTTRSGATPAPFRVAALLTCHDRRETTLRCLAGLFACRLPAGAALEVILVDDGSRDGTGAAVAERYPEVEVLTGDGSLFWAGGTRLAMEEARRRGVDAHLWLNDDVVLAPTALEDLIGSYRQLRAVHGDDVIVVGTMRDPDSGETSYGGVRHASRWHRLKYARLDPSDAPQECTTMNGNLVMIPRSVVERIGVLSPVYVHTIGDYGYGLEARRAGASIWICPGYQGGCGRNDPTGSWEDPDRPLAERLAKLRGVKGLPPRAYARLARLSGARPWPLFVALPYLRVVVTSVRAWLGRTGRRARSG